MSVSEQEARNIAAATAASLKEEEERTIDPTVLSTFLGTKYSLVKTAPDGNCLYAAIADQLFGIGIYPEYNLLLRRLAMDQIAAHTNHYNATEIETGERDSNGNPIRSHTIDGRDITFQDYINKYGKPNEFGGEIEISALADVIIRPIYWHKYDSTSKTITETIYRQDLLGHRNPIHLLYYGLRNRHFDSLRLRNLTYPLENYFQPLELKNLDVNQARDRFYPQGRKVPVPSNSSSSASSVRSSTELNPSSSASASVPSESLPLSQSNLFSSSLLSTTASSASLSSSPSSSFLPAPVFNVYSSSALSNSSSSSVLPESTLSTSPRPVANLFENLDIKEPYTESKSNLEYRSYDATVQSDQDKLNKAAELISIVQKYADSIRDKELLARVLLLETQALSDYSKQSQPAASIPNILGNFASSVGSTFTTVLAPLIGTSPNRIPPPPKPINKPVVQPKPHVAYIYITWQNNVVVFQEDERIVVLHGELTPSPSYIEQVKTILADSFAPIPTLTDAKIKEFHTVGNSHFFSVSFSKDPLLVPTKDQNPLVATDVMFKPISRNHYFVSILNLRAYLINSTKKSQSLVIGLKELSRALGITSKEQELSLTDLPAWARSFLNKDAIPDTCRSHEFITADCTGRHLLEDIMIAEEYSHKYGIRPDDPDLAYYNSLEADSTLGDKKQQKIDYFFNERFLHVTNPNPLLRDLVIPNPYKAKSYRESVANWANPALEGAMATPQNQAMLKQNIQVLDALVPPPIRENSKAMTVAILESLWFCGQNPDLSSDPRCFPSKVLAELREYQNASTHTNQNQRAKSILYDNDLPALQDMLEIIKSKILPNGLLLPSLEPGLVTGTAPPPSLVPTKPISTSSPSGLATAPWISNAIYKILPPNASFTYPLVAPALFGKIGAS